jgi:hypothetical protein
MIQTDKLLALANFLDDLPHRQFYHPEYRSACGSAACICGWAAVKFEGEGWSWMAGAFGPLPAWGSLNGSDAFAEFFGLSYYDALEIVTGPCPWIQDGPWPGGVHPRDMTPHQAADMLRRLVQLRDPAGWARHERKDQRQEVMV